MPGWVLRGSFPCAHREVLSQALGRVASHTATHALADTNSVLDAGVGFTLNTIQTNKYSHRYRAGDVGTVRGTRTQAGNNVSERVALDGSLVMPVPEAQEPPPSAVARSSGIPAAAPDVPPLPQSQLEELVGFVQGCSRLLVLTGAGCSTESNIPDYRGPAGAYKTGFKPMTHQQFMSKPENRARYWARSFVGWHEFAHVEPSGAHEGLARLQSRGWVQDIVTQNVDRLHTKAGARDVLELHGTTHEVVCMGCGDVSCRYHMQERLREANPAAAALADELMSKEDGKSKWERALSAGTAADASKTSGKSPQMIPVRRPDGDVELQDAGQGFEVPPCTACKESLLKPRVVFFGDSVPAEDADRATALADECDGILVVGSSVQVYSSFRLVRAAAKRGVPVVIITAGETRADDVATKKYEALAGETMMRLAAHPAMLLPRV